MPLGESSDPGGAGIGNPGVFAIDIDFGEDSVQTMPSEREIWIRRKIRCKIEARIERALPMGCVRPEGQPATFAKEILAVPSTICRLLCTSIVKLKNINCASRGMLPAGGIFLPVAGQAHSFQEAQ
jgi:hypothetical protein